MIEFIVDVVCVLLDVVGLLTLIALGVGWWLIGDDDLYRWW